MADRLLRSFRFRVQLRRSPEAEAGSAATSSPSPDPGGDPLGDGAFQECSGLEVEMEVQEYQEGGRNDGVIQRAGRAKYVPIVLKRGMFHAEGGQVNTDLWRWFQGAVSGTRPLARYDGTVEVMSEGEDVVATWVFHRGLPAKLRGPQLNAQSGEIAIEELTIAHEGLRLEEG